LVFFSSFVYHRDLHSFPTRRSSDLDLLITVDAGNLWYAAERGALRPTDSEVLRRNIPAHLRDPEDRWFALSVRARTIVYDTRDRSEEHTSELQSRENLVCRLLLYKT